MTNKTKILLVAVAIVCCVCLAACSNNYPVANVHKITVEQTEHATAYVSGRGGKVTQAATGETLFVTIVPTAGYKASSATVNGNKLDGVKFVMPDEDVTVKVTVEAINGNITISESEGGTITADKTNALYGEKVTLTVTPDSGYIMKERSLKVNFSEIFKGQIKEQTEVSFEMPDTDAVVSATFEKLPDTDIRITTYEEYKAFADSVNVSGEKYEGQRVVLLADIGSAENPVKARIGNSSSHYFAGTFDGNGHSVYLAQSLGNSVGMFGYAANATISNVNVYGSVTRTSSTGSSGGIVGAILYGDGTPTTITNCNNYATITSPTSNDVGGIVGATTGNLEIKNCSNYGNVSAGLQRAGGIIGWINKGKTTTAPSVVIEACRNSGEIGGSGAVGQIVGQISAYEFPAITITCYCDTEVAVGVNNNKNKTEITQITEETDEEEGKQ